MARSRARVASCAAAVVASLSVLGAAPPSAQAVTQPAGASEFPGPVPGAGDPLAQATGDRSVAAIPGADAVSRDSWCRVLLPERADAASKAAQIMSGRVDLGMYGSFSLAKTPTWRKSRNLDTSGNEHMHGLFWAMPLLYAGRAEQDQAKVSRFYAILRSWIRAHPANKPRTWTTDQDIIAGERLWTLTCAAAEAPTTSTRAYLRKTVRAESARLLKRFKISDGTNNVAIHAQTGALAASCLLDRGADRQRARRNLAALADYLVLGDGSDREGSPHYGYYTYLLLRGSQSAAKRCGFPIAALDDAQRRALFFLVHASGPDAKLVTLGDSPGSGLEAWSTPADSTARWVATGGTQGTRPVRLNARFAGGYVFGRTSWVTQGGRAPAFYSFRTGLGPSPTAHSHDDIGSVTAASAGVTWLGDPGPWRYDGSPLRFAMVSRGAHNAISATPLRPPRGEFATAKAAKAWKAPAAQPGSRVLSATSDAAADRTCISDTTYPTLSVNRCVTLQRRTGALEVTDSVTARARTRVDQRWHLTPGVRAVRVPAGFALRSGGKAATLDISRSGAGRVTSGQGWFTTAYGKKSPARVLTRSVVLEKGQSARWTTVLRPGS